MSRQPSPGSNLQTSYYRDAHGLPIEKGQAKLAYRGGDQPPTSAQHQHGASVPPQVATSSSSGRNKGRGYQSGIAAGAEDVKYAAKYRDLKHKVKDIESDNDRLLLKVLQAKRNIQRAKLERAILYERLAELPASPPQANAPLPPHHAGQHILSGGSVPRHSDVRPYGQSDRREHVPGPPASHHRHLHHQQQPIQPAPPAHASSPQHHLQVHHTHHPPQDAAHPGQLPITHAQQICTIQTNDGPLRVVAGPDGQPVTTTDGHYIPAQDMHAPPPPPASHHRKRGGRVTKEVREMRDREARELRDREEIERKHELVGLGGTSGGHTSGQQLHLEPPRSSSRSRSHSAPMQGISPEVPSQAPGAPQIVPISSREQRERESDWDMEREMRERERTQRRAAREEERAHGHGHQVHHHRTHGHGQHYHQQSTERGRSPPPPGNNLGPSPIQTSLPLVHRSQSQYSSHSHSSYDSHHGHRHGHHVHTHHSHSNSPHSPGGAAYPQTRMHGHQRVGPGSYVMRDRERADMQAADQAEAAIASSAASATGAQNEEVPPTTAPVSRVPTPPYMQRPVRTDSLASQASAGNEDAAPNTGSGSDSGAKS